MSAALRVRERMVANLCVRVEWDVRVWFGIGLVCMGGLSVDTNDNAPLLSRRMETSKQWYSPYLVPDGKFRSADNDNGFFGLTVIITLF